MRSTFGLTNFCLAYNRFVVNADHPFQKIWLLLFFFFKKKKRHIAACHSSNWPMVENIKPSDVPILMEFPTLQGA